MRIKLGFLSLIALSAMYSPALPVQIGPEIRIGGGNATIGGLGYQNGHVAVPTVDQMIDNAINSSPLTLLSGPDKANIKSAVKTTGFIAAVASDPVTSIVVLSILGGNGQKNDVPIPVVNKPPTGKTWALTAKCVVQQDGGLITAMFNDDPEHIADIAYGDTLNLTAGYCAEYMKHSVTAASIKFTGRSDFPNAVPPVYKHYLVGKTS
jgi:hypothetical protein